MPPTMKRERLEELYRQGERTIETCVRGAERTYARGLDPHEIRSEAHLAFLRVATAWRADGGASFTTLLNLAINRSVRTRSKNSVRHAVGSGSAVTIEPLTDLMTASIRCPSESRSAAHFDECAFNLDGDAAYVLTRLLDGGKLRQIARELNLRLDDVRRLLTEEIVPTVFGCSTTGLWVKARRRRLVASPNN